MDKVTIGIPQGFFYKYHNFWKDYFEALNISVIFSKPTDREIVDLGIKYSNDEMCTSLKNFIGSIAYLQDKCDYILIPRIDNYGRSNQMCTNFMAIYDIATNLFKTPILNFDIDYTKRLTEEKGLIKIGLELGKNKDECLWSYMVSNIKNNKRLKTQYINEFNKLKSPKTKILLMGHSYNIHDNLISRPIVDFLKKNNCEVIYSDNFPSDKTLKLSSNICKYLYWINNKESVGALELCKNKIDGVIMLSSFPCGPDSIVNELVIRNVELPIINLVIDDVNSFTGIETRIESFLDIINNKVIQ